MKPNAYTQINIHLVFAVAKREYCILPAFEERFYAYMGGILKSKGHYPLAINGYFDHVHLLFELNPKQALSDIVREVKASSSVWIHENRFLPGVFSWQAGYGGFSYARSQRPTVIRYIERQKQHHQKTSFKDEYMATLKKFEIDFKEEYLFEFF